MELNDITEESWKFQLNPTSEFEKALYRAEFSNGRISFWRWTTPKSLSLTLKIHVYQDKDSPEISSLPDEEGCGTAIRSLKFMPIYIIKSSKSTILQVQSVCAIFGLCHKTFYIETEVSSLNSSQSASGFCKSTISGGVFKRREFFLALDNSEEFKFDVKNPYLSRERSSRNFTVARRRKLRICDKIAHMYVNLYC